MHIHRKFWFIFFLGVMPLFELRKLTKIKDTTQNSLSAQLHWNRSTEFRWTCSYEGHHVQIWIFTGNADLIFLRSNLYPFWTLAKINLCNLDETGFLFDCPSLMLEIANCCIQHSQTMVERGVCELAHFFFHWNTNISTFKKCSLLNSNV